MSAGSLLRRSTEFLVAGLVTVPGGKTLARTVAVSLTRSPALDRLTRLRIFNAIAQKAIPDVEVRTKVQVPDLPGVTIDLQLALTDDLSREWYYFGYDKYEVPVRRVLSALVASLQPGRPWCLLDVGANIGYFSLYLAALAKAADKGCVHAFEPSPAVFELLLRHLGLNSGLPLKLNEAAVSDTCGRQTLFLAHEQYGHSAASLVAGAVEQTGTVSVETTTLDDYLEQVGTPPVGLLKMDCEGAESKVLAGMVRTIDRNSPPIILEILPRFASLPIELAALPFFDRYRKFQITEGGLIEHERLEPSYGNRDWLFAVEPPPVL